MIFRYSLKPTKTVYLKFKPIKTKYLKIVFKIHYYCQYILNYTLVYDGINVYFILIILQTGLFEMLKQIALITLMGLSTSAVMAGQWQVKVGGSAVAPTQDNSYALGNAKLKLIANLRLRHQFGAIFLPSY